MRTDLVTPAMAGLLALAGCSSTPEKADSAPPGELPELGDSGDGCLADELACDGVDDDCDGEVDEGLLVDFYEDLDGDGVGSEVREARCPAGYAGWSLRTGDCDDGNAAVSPDAVELCNTVDDNCDGTVDEGLEPPTWYADADGDGFGTEAGATAACERPEGHVPRLGDCDDTDAAVHPLAAERCGDAVDNDCDGTVDNLAVCCISTTPETDRYVLCTEPLSWAEAAAQCAAEGASMVVLDSAEEDGWLDEVVDWLDAPIWIGATDATQEGRWDALDGSAVPFHDWASGEPDGDAGDDQDCAVIEPASEQWADRACDEAHAWVCEL